MPSLMASIGLDTARFNAGAAKVVNTARVTGAKVTAGLTPKVVPYDMRRTAGLATDPRAVMFAEERATEMARRRQQTMAAHNVWLEKRRAQEKALHGDLDRNWAKSKAQRELNREMGYVPLAAHVDRYGESAKKAARETSALGRAGAMFAGYLTVGFAARQVREVINYGGEVSDLSERLGISTDAVQKWDYALKLNGSSMQRAQRFFEELARRRDEVLRADPAKMNKYADASKILGITAEDFRTKRLEDVAGIIAKNFQTGDPQKMIGALRELGGSGAIELATAFRSGMDAFFAEAPLIKEEHILNLDRMGDLWERFKMQATSALAPLASLVFGRFVDQIEERTTLLGGAKAGAKEGWKRGLEGIAEAEEKGGGVLAKWAGFFTGFFSGAKEGSLAKIEESLAARAAEPEKRERLAKARREAEEAIIAAEGDAMHAKQEASKREKEIDRAREKGAKLGEMFVGEQQRKGVFFGGLATAGAAMAPEMAAFSVQAKSEEHLRSIRDDIHAMATGKEATKQVKF